MQKQGITERAWDGYDAVTESVGEQSTLPQVFGGLGEGSGVRRPADGLPDVAAPLLGR